MIAIEAINDPLNGFVLPWFCAEALSTYSESVIERPERMDVVQERAMQ